MTSWRPTLSGLLQPRGGYRRWAALLALLGYLFAATIPAMAGMAPGVPGTGGVALVTCHVAEGVAVLAVATDPAEQAPIDGCCLACLSAQLGQSLPDAVGLSALSARAVAVVSPHVVVMSPRGTTRDHRARAPPVARPVPHFIFSL